MTYRARCAGRKGKRRDGDYREIESMMRQTLGAHHRWEAMAGWYMPGWVDPVAAWATRRQRRTWQPNGPKAQANRRRDSSRRRPFVWFVLIGDWLARGTVVLFGPKSEVVVTRPGRIYADGSSDALFSEPQARREWA